MHKLHPMLPNLVSPLQTTFIPGRHITDNIFFAQEILHKYKLSRGKTGFLAWKIDLSKAYDRLSWHFIADVLRKIGITGTFFKLIMQCITTVTYQAIVNGDSTPLIKPICGLCQGDHLSPYVFVLCLKKLHIS